MFNDIYGIAAPNVYTHRNAASFPVGPDPTLLYGVELEIEGLTREFSSYPVSGIVHTEDGSLRNNGCEFITKPMTFQTLGYVLTTFFNKNKFTAENYSDRTSVHVHCNIGDMSLEQIQTLFTLYSTFERVLFGWIGSDRQNNIYCVPLHETNLCRELVRGGNKQIEVDNFRNWRKYTALNLLPMFSQSTVEFRHMAGEADVSRIMMWCTLLGKLFAYAKTNTLTDTLKTITALNSNSAYNIFLNNVFGECAVLFNGPTFQQDVEDGVLDVKFAITADMLKEKVVPKPREKRLVDEQGAALLDRIAAQQRIADENARQTLRQPNLNLQEIADQIIAQQRARAMPLANAANPIRVDGAGRLDAMRYNILDDIV